MLVVASSLGQGSGPFLEAPSQGLWCPALPVLLLLLLRTKLPRPGPGLLALEGSVALVESAALECLQVPWCLSPERELESELELNRGKFQAWGSPVCTQAECFQAQELASLEWGCSLESPLEPESRPRPQVEVLLLESQGLGLLGASSLGSP